MSSLSLEDRDRLLFGNLEAYSNTLVRIKRKDAQMGFLQFRNAQKILDRALTKQREKIGRVRALVLKGRQMGISTYICARFYQKTTINYGQRTYILTHEDAATQNLFDMVRRVHEGMDDAYRLQIRKSNSTELMFADNDSGYRVGTAGNRIGIGRSSTIQNFHGSEISFWPDASKHFAGALATVPSLPGTEIILESTANGIGNEFHKRWLQAERGEGDFIAVFLPWYIHEEYVRTPELDFELSEEEANLLETFNLTIEQLCWAHYTNIDLGGDPGVFCPTFKAEYPSTTEEAFQATGGESFIKSFRVARARAAHLDLDEREPIILGVDCAGGGRDKTRIIDRQGRVAGRHCNITMNTDDTTIIADMVAVQIKEFKVDRVEIDYGNMGHGVVDTLKRWGLQRVVRGVNFGSNAVEKERYYNRRAEIWSRMNDWFKDEGGCDIPDSDEIHRAICAPAVVPPDSKRRVKLEQKEQIEKRLHLSPDAGDALALTFADRHVVRVNTTPDIYAAEENDDSRYEDWMVN